MAIKSYRGFLAVVLMAIVLAGCAGSDMSDLREFVDTAHQDKKPEIEPLPEIPPFKAFEYQSEDEVDPFGLQNIISQSESGDATIGQAQRPDANRRREPLEQFPLDALKMVGTITNKEGVSHVVVSTAEGTALLAKIGNYLGQNDGKIASISPEEQKVVLVETILDPSGRWVTRDVEITIDE